MLTGGSRSAAAGQMGVLRQLAGDLGDAVTPDDVARAALRWSLRVDGVVRAGMAVSQEGGRQLRFVSTDDDGLTPTSARWCHIDALADVPLAQSVRDGSAVYLRSTDELGARYPLMLSRQAALGTRGMATLPLGAGDRPVGGLLLSFGEEREFGADEQAFLAAFAAQIGQALRRGLAYQAEQTTAERLQRLLLPQSLPDLDGLSLGAHYQPGGEDGEVGGDWYDVLALADGSAVVALGDVMGKGAAAALVMGQVRAAMRAYALLDPTPSVVLDRLDVLLRSLAVPEQLVTLAYGVVRADRRSIQLCVAGHPPPLLVRPGEDPLLVGGEVGPPLGLAAGPWTETSVELDDDLTVLFYSDGLVHTREMDFFAGLGRLCRDLTQIPVPRHNPREMCAHLGHLAWDRKGRDDVTMLAVGRTSRRRLHSATEDLPADASASPKARHFLRSRLNEWGLDGDVVETAQLCVSELVTNAVIHSGTTSQLTVRLDDERLLVAVRDHGNHGAVRQLSDSEPMVISGRGLTIVDVLAAAWSAERSVDGTTVWFELEVPAGATV